MIIRDLVDMVNREKRKKENVKVVKIAAGMVFVAVAGAAIGIIFAPKSGKETREYLKEKAVDTVAAVKDTVQKTAKTVKDCAAGVAQEINSGVEDMQEKEEPKDNP